MCWTLLKLPKSLSYFQLLKALPIWWGFFVKSKAPKRAMLIADEHQMDEPKHNNHKEADKPWCQKLADGLKTTCGYNADRQMVKAARTDGEPAE